MKWMLVVLVGGVTPVQTDVLFEKLADCLAAEEQLRTAYADALEVLGQESYVSVRPPPWLRQGPPAPSEEARQ